MTREIALDSGTLTYELVRKNVKRVNLRIRPDGSVTVSAPARVPLEMIENFLRRKEDFLWKAIKKSEERKNGEIRCADGERIPYLGGALTLSVEKGSRYGAVLEGNVLYFRLRVPDDPAARMAALARWKKAQCAQLAKELLDRWYPVMQPLGVPYPTLRFREMTSRWGSCIPKKQVVTLNTRLLALPECCIEYILVHELCHFLQPDHSAAFYGWMDRFLPDWRERRALLRENG